MKRKSISIILILLAGTLVFPIGSHSFAITSPIATNDSYSKNENNVLVVDAPGVLANDTAATGKILSASLVTDVKNGTLILNTNGGFVYVPNFNFQGVDSFRYVANDGTLSSNIVNVTLTINPVNHLPIARNDIYTINENATLNIQGNGVLANDTDADGNTLKAFLVTDVLNGALTLNPNGSFTYAPHPNFHGMDSFTYKANDGVANSTASTVTIVVNQVNSTPPPSDPLLQLIQQIQNLFTKITGIEQQISDLQAKNTALESRVTQLENLIQNNNHGTIGQNQTKIEHQEDDEHDNKNKQKDNNQENKDD